MRLIKLRIKNIASLKGEHEIDFASIQSQSPLFAITGETGAGKSSILNSIGMVLYGKVYKSNLTQNDLVTLGEKEGQIELIFQAQEKNYLALWRARVRKQNGEFYSTPQPAQREIYVLDGDQFESHKTILNVRAEELLNLDFDQFCKCIILNQGEFAKFLSSSFTERKDILEKMYPGEMFDKLSTKLKEEKTELEKQISDLDIELHTLKGDGLKGEDLTSMKDKLEAEYKLHESWLTTLESMDYHFTSLYSHHKSFTETKLRIETVKATLNKETSIFNDFLITTQKASEELLQIQKEQTNNLPKLQELLKSEEALKHAQTNKAENEKSRNVYLEQVQKLQDRQVQLARHLKEWEQNSQDLIKSFTLPLSELKTHARSLERVFDLHNKKELLEQELSTKEERLTQLEMQGKDEALALKELTSKKTSFEEEKTRMQILETKKKELMLNIEGRARAGVKLDELNLKILGLIREKSELDKKDVLMSSELIQYQQEFLPLETTIKLQNLLSAVEICLTHPMFEEDKACPVCKTNLPDDRIQDLKSNLEKTDFSKIKIREAELSRMMMKKEAEIYQLKDKDKQLQEELALKTKEIEIQSEISKQILENPETVEHDLKDSQKKVWEQEKIHQDEARLAQTVAKTREQYLLLKNDILGKGLIKTQFDKDLGLLITPMSFIKELNTASISQLINESRKLSTFLENEFLGEKLKQDQVHHDENTKQAELNLSKIKSTLAELETRIVALSSTIDKELKGKKASDLISELAQKVKEKTDVLGLKERELKFQESKLKESQGRLYTLDEQIKNVDLMFSKELHTLRECAHVSLPSLTNELSILTDKLGNLVIELNSPEALFIPLKDLIQAQKHLFKDKTSELKMSFASVRARLEDWEKRQDRITLLLLKLQDLTQSLDRRVRLYEVLGKDELRTFVLSLVEENLITQTNEELQKLCQGRYEIIHQSRKMKLTPEFYILDKFREAGMRKVSTLSGGETFMVSLAMALGLAEMTRGKAEIDTLFIDEGFGTLDQDSLEDVLDMLKQIQTRGLMVGIISHVKELTHALPVNLQVTKKQDGTSSLGIQYN